MIESRMIASTTTAPSPTDTSGPRIDRLNEADSDTNTGGIRITSSLGGGFGSRLSRLWFVSSSVSGAPQSNQLSTAKVDRWAPSETIMLSASVSCSSPRVRRSFWIMVSRQEKRSRLFRM